MPQISEPEGRRRHSRVLNGNQPDSLQIASSHFDPRIGIAYALNSKTIIHAGYGMFHMPAAAWEQFPDAYATSRTSNSIVAQANGVTPLFNLSNPFPQGLPTPCGNSAGLAMADLGQTIEGPLHTQTISYMNNYSFDVQRQLPGKFVVTAALCGQYRRTPADSGRFQSASPAISALGNAIVDRGEQSVLWRDHRSQFHAEPAHRAVGTTAAAVSAVHRCGGDQRRGRTFFL